MNDMVIKLDWEKGTEELKKTVMEGAGKYSKEHALKEKDMRHLCLAGEETMEMIGLLKTGRPEELHFDETDKGVRIRLITEKTQRPGEEDFATLSENARGVTGKLRMLYECGYEGLEKNSIKAEELGVRKAQTEDLKEMGFEEDAPAYIWTLQSYDYAAFDHILENDEQWQEISHSILANLAEDIRLIVFPDKMILDVRLSAEEEVSEPGKGYAISHEFDSLKKIPVFKTRFQVKLVQLLYRRLASKQRSKPGIDIKEIKIPSVHSKKGSIPVLWYRPDPMPEISRTVVFFHGGADLFPALPYHYALSEKMVRGAGCQVFLVLHDLAPKTNPPVQILEGLEVYNTLVKDERYSVSPEKTAIIGDSSGGTMTAAVALLARDGLAPAPAGQLLLYPSLDMRYNTPSMKKYRDVPIVNGEAIDSYRKIVRSDWSEGNKYYMSPTEAESFEGLCDAYVETAEFDALHDEGVEYAEKLKAAGVRVVLNETKGTVHSFDMAKNSSIVAEAVKSRLDFLHQIFI